MVSLRRTLFLSSQLCHPWPSSSVVPIALARALLTESHHLRFGLPLLLRLPGGTIMQRLSSDFVSYLRMAKPPQSSFPAFLCYVKYLSLSLMLSFLTWTLGDMPIDTCHFRCIHMGTSHRHCLQATDSIAGWTIVL